MFGSKLGDRLGNWNPQLLREIQGRIKPRNLVVIAIVAILGQILLMLGRMSGLPSAIPPYDPTKGFSNRYCLGSPPRSWSGYSQANAYIPEDWCWQDLHGDWILNWQLWWLDIFTFISFAGIALAIAAGCYLLIVDLVKEQQRGTLNFLRLSPQPAKDILLGKILGVPILLYFLAVLCLPLHLWAGLSASIPLSLILGFYGVCAAGLLFFYRIAILLGLQPWKMGVWQPFLLIYGIFSLFMPVVALVGSRNFISHTAGDWLFLFFPGSFIGYLQDATFLPLHRYGHAPVSTLGNLRWYGMSLFHQPWLGMVWGILHYGLWSYWLDQSAQCRFHQPDAPLLTKAQSYAISLFVAAIALGFTLQTSDPQKLTINYRILEVAFSLGGVILAIALMPSRLHLQDWSRHRHHQPQKSLVRDLILGQNSPIMLSIFLSSAIFLAFILPSVLLASLGDDRGSVVTGFIFSFLAILFYGAIAQRLVLLRHFQLRRLATVFAFVFLFIVPWAMLLRLNVVNSGDLLLFFSVPMAGILHFSGFSMLAVGVIQAIAIVLVLTETTYQLRKIGESSSKSLFSEARLPIS